MAAETLLAVEFANTAYTVRGKPADRLPAWLQNHGHSADAASAGFAELRDALRSLIAAAIAAEPYPAEALATLNAASACAPYWLELGPAEADVTEKTAATGADAERGRIARAAVALLGSADREALRSCQAPGCVQFFLKTHPRQEFCGPACGNRARAARHYARHKE
jgi:predicted RNA-binding Zn ribbon-like protein